MLLGAGLFSEAPWPSATIDELIEAAPEELRPLIDDLATDGTNGHLASIAVAERFEREVRAACGEVALRTR